MVESTISQHTGPRLGSLDVAWRRRLGTELRRRREASGLSQSALGDPLTRAFVSSVEHGRIVPSLPALRHMLARLGLTLATFFADWDERSVERQLTVPYHPGHGDAGPDATTGGRRPA
jgi:transcriptional regulator with XRE-family HTH domain